MKQDAESFFQSTPIGFRIVRPFPVPEGTLSFVSGDSTGKRFRARYFFQDETLELRGHLFFGPETQGPPGYCHGGSIASVLDEAMGAWCWTREIPVLAGEIVCRFHKPLPLLSFVEVRANLLSKKDRKHEMAATIYRWDPVTSALESKPTATSSGTFVRIKI